MTGEMLSNNLIVVLFVSVLIASARTQVISRDNTVDPQVPFFGSCDRIAIRGVLSCMENFLPNRIIFEEGHTLCCAYSKYKACLSGLYDGLRLSFERSRCPKSTSTRMIMSLGDSVGGLTLRLICERSDGSNPCQKVVNTNKIEAEILNEP